MILASPREAHLPLVEPWFDDGETRRWLGDRAWPAAMPRANLGLSASRSALAREGAAPSRSPPAGP